MTLMDSVAVAATAEFYPPPAASCLPTISVIVPVRNEARHILHTLDRLLSQNYDPERYEILVIDGCSTDGTPELVAPLLSRHRNLKLLTNPRRWSSAARNLGVRHSRGELIVVVDGHCQIDDDNYLANLASAFETSGADCLGRPQPLDVSQATVVQRAVAAARSSPLGHHPDSFIYASCERFVPAKSVAVAYRRSVFEALGAFDETFDACEDVEFNHRVDRAGLRCYFTPKVAVRYCPRGTLGGLFRQMVRYGRGRIRLLRKHGDTVSLRTLIPLLFVMGLIGGLPACAAVAPLWPVYLGTLAVYAAAVGVASLWVGLQKGNAWLLPLLPCVFATIHIGSGTGMLLELCKIGGRRPRAVEPGGHEPMKSGPLRIVVVDEEFPYPPNSGKRIRTLNLLLPLAERHRITYLAHRGNDDEETQQATEFLHTHGIETQVVDRVPPVKAGVGFYARLLWNLISPLPYSVQTHNSAALRGAITRYAADHSIDLWHCEWTPYAQSLLGTVDRPWVAAAHNVESLIWQRYVETEPGRLKRWYIRRQWRKFQRFERRIFAATGKLIAVSDNDALLAREDFAAPRVAVVENGVDVRYFHPDGTARDHRSILFLGSLDWRPNLDAVQLLLDRVFPEVLAAEPEARLHIAGRKPPRWLAERVAACPNVELHADLPDVRPLLRRCGLLAVPLRIGGGSRLKILEALAVECPVVSTKVGAEGLCLEAGQHLVEVEVIEEMATALVDAIRRPEAMAEMARAGRKVVLARYDWSILAKKLESIWREQANAQDAAAEGYGP